MLIDTRNLENNSIIEGDICIIGAGAAGISIAMEYINSPYKIILLEGGGFQYEDKMQELYKGKTSGQHYFPLSSTRMHYFGGTSNIWGGYCSQLDEIDFKKRDWVEHSGWPITKKDLDPYYKRAKNILDLHDENYNVKHWQEKDPSKKELLNDDSVVWNKMWQFSPPTRLGSKYKNDIIDSKNIHLYSYANVTNITSNETVTHIERVTIKNHEGKTHTVKATHFVLACGAIQNTRLLLASNKQAKKGIGNDNDVVGRYFMEHLEMDSAELWLTLPKNMSLYEYNGRVLTKARAELAITENAQKEFKILNGTASFTPLSKGRYVKPYIDLWKNNNPKKNKLSTWTKVKNKLLVLRESTTPNIGRAYELFTRIEQSPNPSSRIKIDSENDKLGVPRAKLHWELTSLEKRSMRKIYELIGQQLGIEDVGRIKLMEYLQNEHDNSWPDFTSAGWHHIGTTRMSDDPKKGVVDANCKLHGIDNLFVAGSSCFVTSGAVNPTFTIVALSIRLSDHIKKIL